MAANLAALAQALATGRQYDEAQKQRKAATLAAIGNLAGAALGGTVGGIAGRSLGDQGLMGAMTGLGVGGNVGQVLGGVGAGSRGAEYALQGAQNLPGSFSPLLARASAKSESGTDPASVAEWRFFQSLSPEEKIEYLNLKRLDPAARFLDIKSAFIQPATGTRIEKEVAPEQEPEFRAEVKAAEVSAEQKAKKEAADPEKRQKAVMSFNQLERQSNIVERNIQKAINLISPWSTGYGSFLAILPETDARELRNTLETIKANIGFDKLQAMRDASPTGGALGQVSELENKLLQAVNGALDPAQSGQLRENLINIGILYNLVLEERRGMLESDYGIVTVPARGDKLEDF